MSAFGGKADITKMHSRCPLLTHLRYWLCPAAIVSVPYQSTCIRGRTLSSEVGNRMRRCGFRVSQHRGGLTACGARAVAGKVRLFHPTNWSVRTWGRRAVLPSFEVEWAFHPCSISSKETNNRGENYHEGDCGDGSGRGTGRHEAGGAARAAGSDKRRHRSGSCVGIRPD